MDNDDVKIFSPEESDHPKNEDLDSLAAETEALRESGNLGVAKRLGRELASLSSHSPELLALSESFGFTLNAAREQQLHVLMVFSGQHALRTQLPQLLSEAAITTMNNYLINKSKEFWDTISDGSEFTQYLLVAPVPKKADACSALTQTKAEQVGSVFAHMCGQEDNPDLCKLGATVFITTSELVKARLEAVS